jgi:hypothetical protein
VSHSATTSVPAGLSPPTTPLTLGRPTCASGTPMSTTSVLPLSATKPTSVTATASLASMGSAGRKPLGKGR